MFSNAPIAIAVFCKDSNYLYHSVEWLGFFNQPSLVGQKHSTLFPESSPEWQTRFELALSGTEIENLAEQGGPISDDLRYFDTTFRPWYQEDDSIGGVVVAIKDVTEEQQSKKAASEVQRRFERATTAGKVGIFEYRSTDDTFFINSIGMEMLSLSLREFDRIDIEAFKSRLAAPSVTKLEAKLARCIESEQQITAQLDSRPWYGNVVKLEINLSPWFEDDMIVGVSGVFTDVTDIIDMSHQTEELLLESEAINDELKREHEQQRRMFAVIGHELRTPAAALGMLIDQDPVVEKSAQFKTLKSTCEQLLSVLDQLSVVNRPQERNLKALKVESPAQVVQDVVDALQPALERSKISMHLDLNRLSHTLCKFDTQALRQVLSNLIRNTEVHSGASDLWVTFHAVRLQRDKEKIWFQLVVSDNGRGVPRSHQEAIFEPFYRVDESRDGSGIGLHLCQSLAGALGGVISYEDRPEQGAQFVLNMMLDQVDETDDEADKGFVDAVDRKPKKDVLDGKYILVAEDNKTIQTITKAMLMKAGAKVAVADDGQKALDLFSNNQLFDLVLTDIFMPRMDGYGLTEKLREAGYSKSIIGVTAATIGDESDQLLEAGASAVLAKPLSITVLRDTLESLGHTQL